MKNIFASLTVLVLFLSIQPASAQFGMGKKKEIEMAKSRPLIVIIEEENPKVIEKLTKKKKTDKIPLYRAAIAEYNDGLKATVEKFWTFNKKVEYKTFKQVEEMYKAKDQSYAVLQCVTMRTNKTDMGAKNYHCLDWSYNKTYDVKKENDDRDYWDSYSIMEVRLIEELKDRATVSSQNLPNVFPGKADIVYGILATQAYFNGRLANASRGDIKDMVKENQPKLAKKTLLMREDWVKGNVTPSEINAEYPYKYKLVSPEAFEEKIVEADPDYAYVQIVPFVSSSSKSIQVYYVHYVIDAADGTVLGMSTPQIGLMMLTGGMAGKGSKVVTKRDIKNYVEYVNNK